MVNDALENHAPLVIGDSTETYKEHFVNTSVPVDKIRALGHNTMSAKKTTVEMRR
jgi:hypothetical protein